MRTAVAAALLLCLAAPSARAEEAPVDPLAVELARMVVPPSTYDQLLATVDAQISANMTKMMETMAPREEFDPKELVALYSEDLRKLLRTVMPSYEDMIAVQARLLAKHYTAEELQGLRAFYQGPLGKKTVEIMPAVMKDAMAWMQTSMMDKMPGAMAEFRAAVEPKIRTFAAEHVED